MRMAKTTVPLFRLTIHGYMTTHGYITIYGFMTIHVYITIYGHMTIGDRGIRGSRDRGRGDTLIREYVDKGDMRITRSFC